MREKKEEKAKRSMKMEWKRRGKGRSKTEKDKESIRGRRAMFSFLILQASQIAVQIHNPHSGYKHFPVLTIKPDIHTKICITLISKFSIRRTTITKPSYPACRNRDSHSR